MTLNTLHSKRHSTRSHGETPRKRWNIPIFTTCITVYRCHACQKLQTEIKNGICPVKKILLLYSWKARMITKKSKFKRNGACIRARMHGENEWITQIGFHRFVYVSVETAVLLVEMAIAVSASRNCNRMSHVFESCWVNMIDVVIMMCTFVWILYYHRIQITYSNWREYILSPVS